MSTLVTFFLVLYLLGSALFAFAAARVAEPPAAPPAQSRKAET